MTRKKKATKPKPRELTPEERVNEARSIMRRDYENDVDRVAESIKSELDDRLKNLREWLLEHIHETIDSSFAAFEADVMEALTRLGVNVNKPDEGADDEEDEGAA